MKRANDFNDYSTEYTVNDVYWIGIDIDVL